MNAPNMFWLKGVAGSGKTTTAYTITKSLRKEGLLTSSFFFDRNDTARNTQYLTSIIALDIEARHLAIAADITIAKKENTSLPSASLVRQFEAFILEPLRHHPIGRPMAVIIDASNEILRDDSDATLLPLDHPPDISKVTRIRSRFQSPSK